MTPLTLSPAGGGLDAAATPNSTSRERNAGPSAFARELRQQQSSANRPPQRSEHDKPDATDEPDPAAPIGTPAQRQRAADARARGKASAAGERPSPPKTESPAQGSAPDAAGQADAQTAPHARAADLPAADPSLATPTTGALNPLAGPPAAAMLGGPARAVAPGPAGTPCDATPAIEAADAAPPDPTSPAAPAAGRGTLVPAGAHPPEAAQPAEAVGQDAMAAGATDPQPDPSAAGASRAAPTFAEVLVAAGGAEGRAPAHPAASTNDSPHPAAPALAGEIEPEVGSPGFAPALGARLTLLARDGVQEARLALHPADLGPITVQIAVDGAAAHIHFLAEQAGTCRAIESSLPALAAALREGGFTLAGGGVSQHNGQGRQGDGGAAPNRPSRALNGVDGGTPGATALQRAATTRGLVDLIA